MLHHEHLEESEVCGVEAIYVPFGCHSKELFVSSIIWTSITNVEE
jgi:hypothetical protein